jgi:6-phosphogluconolactonase
MLLTKTKDNARTMNTDSPHVTELYVAHSKEDIPEQLFQFIHRSLLNALQDSSEFYIALSGGSLPSLLTFLPQSFTSAKIDPQWDKWRVILADERLVQSTHPDSNLKSLKECFLDKVPIPADKIYGIDESLLTNEHSWVDNIAEEYENRVFSAVRRDRRRGYLVDCVLLGFGPDGHTASLFPNHDLLEDQSGKLVLGIMDSPKPPPQRITLSMNCLNEVSRNVIFVGAGESKAPILRDIFLNVKHEATEHYGKVKKYVATMKDVRHQRYPCGMIRPKDRRLVYITDASGAEELLRDQHCFCSLL